MNQTALEHWTLMRYLLALLSLALFSSCGTTSGVARDFKLDPSGPNGLVVGTITYETFTGAYGLGWKTQQGQARFTASVGFSNWPPLGPEYDPDLKAKGGTFAVVVPAGEYSVHGWWIRQGLTIYSPSTPVDIPFTVAAGKITYLGSLNFRKSDDVTLEDRAERDFPVLRARYHAMTNSPIAVAIAPGTKVESFGGEMNKRFLTPIFIPVAW